MGNIIRRNEAIPANKAIELYFTERDEKEFRGRHGTTLPITLECDQDHSYFRMLKINNTDDLETLRRLASDRTAWRRLVQKIVEVSKATHSIDDNMENQ